MQEPGSTFFDSTEFAFVVETTPTEKYTAFYDKAAKELFIYCATNTKYIILDREYDDCDKTKFANALLTDLDANKNNLTNDLALQPDTNVIKARGLTISYREGCGIYGKSVSVNYIKKNYNEFLIFLQPLQ